VICSPLFAMASMVQQILLLPGWVFTFVLEFHYYDTMSQKWGILFSVVRGLEIATPSARNDREKARNDAPYVIARHKVPKQSHAIMVQ